MTFCQVSKPLVLLRRAPIAEPAIIPVGTKRLDLRCRDTAKRCEKTAQEYKRAKLTILPGRVSLIQSMPNRFAEKLSGNMSCARLMAEVHAAAKSQALIAAP